ncbi:penicillin acylase family protein [Nostoc cycadae]|uniref:Penicillin amidase n=2 Tax=Nostocales TaxID=1161 RepID=A0A2H6LN21_9NOSO|nr:penicillin acylase family protein [Nostoc cycadae]GBE94607.1 penicillin amidase [Nostoc cycadae WK-1]
MIVDLGNLDKSLAIHTPGQSGQAFHQHYADMVEPWHTIEYHPILWDSKTVKGNTAKTLKLIRTYALVTE